MRINNNIITLAPSMACLIVALMSPLSACTAGGGDNELMAGVLVPCPGNADPVPAGPPCGLVCRAALPIRVSNSRLFLVDISVNGKPATVVLDTGASQTALSPSAADRIGLAPSTPQPRKMFAIGGATDARSTPIESIAIGHLQLGPGHVYVIPQATAVAGTGELGYDGLLGNDILARYQMDLDFAHQIVRLYDGKRCPGLLPGWPSEAAIVPFINRPGTPLVAISAALNGVAVPTLLDTGAEMTVAGENTARRLKVGPTEMQHDAQIAALGIGPTAVPGHIHYFDNLQLGGAIVANPAVQVIPEQLPNPGMILGDTVLSNRRVWIDYPGRQVHFGFSD